MEAQRSSQSAQAERATVEERLRGLQRAVAMLETEKKDAERQAVRMEKDKNALRSTLDKVSSQSNGELRPSNHLCFCLTWCPHEHLFLSQTISNVIRGFFLYSQAAFVGKYPLMHLSSGGTSEAED